MSLHRAQTDVAEPRNQRFRTMDVCMRSAVVLGCTARARVRADRRKHGRSIG